MFCEECKNLVRIEQKNNGETLAVCDHCDTCKLITDQMSFSESKDKNKDVGEGIIKEDIVEGKGYPHKCKKCGHAESEIMIINPIRAGEPDRILYRCKRCNFADKNDGIAE